MAWLKLKAFADLTGTSYSTIYRMVKDGDIPAYRLGGQWRVDPEEAKGCLRQAWETEKAKSERRKARASKTVYQRKDWDYVGAVMAIKSRWKGEAK